MGDYGDHDDMRRVRQARRQQRRIIVPEDVAFGFTVAAVMIVIAVVLFIFG